MISERQAKRFCCEPIENIENYSQANTDTEKWVCHHRLETDEDGNTLYTKDELIVMNMYDHRPATELIFLTYSEHAKIHNTISTITHEQRVKGGEIVGKMHKDSKWWNNGVVNKRAFECPEGFVPGMLRKKGA